MHGSRHCGVRSHLPHMLKNLSRFGFVCRMCICCQRSQIKSPGNGRAMDNFQQNQHRAQFLGSYSSPQNQLIWQAREENKCKVFTWILTQNKILTADNLAQRGWPHQNSCAALCNGPLETGQHLCLLCPFAKVVWTQVAT